MEDGAREGAGVGWGVLSCVGGPFCDCQGNSQPLIYNPSGPFPCRGRWRRKVMGSQDEEEAGTLRAGFSECRFGEESMAGTF